MQAKEAIPILDRVISRLETNESSWRNCRSCPFNGKCCDGATLKVFPEEGREILQHIKLNPNVRAHSIGRYKDRKPCYFYDRDAKACLIHEIRPINCRWTPYTVFIGDAGLSGMMRDSQCNFRHIQASDRIDVVDDELIRFSTSRSNENNHYILWQKIEELRPMMERNHELIPLEEIMEAAIAL